MFIVYVEYDKDDEDCTPYTGKEYYTKPTAEIELKEAKNDPEIYHAWIEEV